MLFCAVPGPTITVSVGPIFIIAGSNSNVTVICTVDLNQYVNVELTVSVSTLWTLPTGVTFSPTDPLMESNRYTIVLPWLAHLGEISLESTTVQLP